MIEKIEIGKCLSKFPDGDADKIVGLSGANCILTTSSSIVNEGGCGKFIRGMSYGKWYRIAIGSIGNYPSCGLFNIAHIYGTSPCKNVLFYAFATGYSGGSFINKIAGTDTASISKIRVLYKSSNTENSESMLDVFSAMSNNNQYIVSASCLIGFKLQYPVAVEADIPEGYLVKELIV